MHLLSHSVSKTLYNFMWFHGSPGMTSPTQFPTLLASPPLPVPFPKLLPTLPRVDLASLFESWRLRAVIEHLPTSTDILGGLKSRNTKNICPEKNKNQKLNISDFSGVSKKEEEPKNSSPHVSCSVFAARGGESSGPN